MSYVKTCTSTLHNEHVNGNKDSAQEHRNLPFVAAPLETNLYFLGTRSDQQVAAHISRTCKLAAQPHWQIGSFRAERPKKTRGCKGCKIDPMYGICSASGASSCDSTSTCEIVQQQVVHKHTCDIMFRVLELMIPAPGSASISSC